MNDETTEITTREPNAYETALFMVDRINPQQLLEKAVDAKVPIETLERLIALRERLKAEQARELFFSALSSFQQECPIIPKTKTATIQSQRGSYKYAYAPLDVIVEKTSPILAKYGLSVTFDTNLEREPLSQVAICTVHHVAGHGESSAFRAPIDTEARMNDMQKAASAQTYAKRYAYCNALGILTGDDDDDAHATSAKEAFPPPRRTAAPPEPDAVQARGDRTRSVGHVTPPARGATITPGQKVSLEKAIRELEAAKGVPYRDKVKQQMDEKLHKQHMLELTESEYETLQHWIAGQWNT